MKVAARGLLRARRDPPPTGVPIRYSKRIFEIAVPLPIKKGRRPKHPKDKSVRRNSAKQPEHGDNAATHSAPDSVPTPHPTTVDCTPGIASVPPVPTNAGGGRPKTRKAGNPSKPHLTEEEKRERDRKRAAERRQHQKENNLCISCPNQPIEGRTRCQECAERHRQYWQNWKPKRKSTRPGPEE